METTIIIPVYEMHGEGVEYLSRCLDSIDRQTYKDYQVIIVDSSDSDDIWESLYSRDTSKIVYVKSFEKGASVNTNKGIELAKGYFIKVLHQDDFFAHDNSLLEIVNHEGWRNHDWMVTGCTHTHGKDRFNDRYPSVSNDVVLENLIGAPSVVTFKNHCKTRFNPELKWIFDGVFYKEMIENYGLPIINPDINVVICVGKHQATNILTNKEKQDEIDKYIQGTL